MDEILELKTHLEDYVESITTKSRNGAYICPICGSGTGKNKSGAFSITPDGQGWKCFSCNNGGDIFNLIEHVENITEFNDQIKRAKEIFNIYTSTSIKNKPIKSRGERVQKELKTDFTSYINNCIENVHKTDYFKKRGFNNEIISRFNLGYDENKKAVVIPYNKEKSYFITRSTEGKNFRKPKSDIAGSEPIFNLEAFKSDKPIFIVESPIDALSIIQAGGEAVALGGTGITKLTNYLKDNPVKNTLIINLDNDEAGKKGTNDLKEELDQIKINNIEASYNYSLYSDNKDANELLVSNPDLFIKEVEENINRADPLINYLKNNATNLLNNFNKEIKHPFISTGFKELDKILDGGLYPGLYILGAISSLGKTTLFMQVAENIAKAGEDVIIFSLEMGAGELISKSLSRLTYIINPGYAKTFREINKGYYSDYEAEVINQASRSFKQYSNNLYIFEGIGNIGIEEIKKRVEDHIKITGKKPVVFIDYLQVITPLDFRATDKQNTDKTVLELKRLSRDIKTPVVCISSFNRDSYLTPVNMSAFKESGAIEYGSDVLLALQPAGMKPGRTEKDKKENEDIVDNCKKSNERFLELKVLKNRNGATNGVINFKYLARYNYFEEGNFIDYLKREEEKIVFL